MARSPNPKRPTDAELTILRILWEHGPATVRQVHTILNKDRNSGYTTALKLMQIMNEKGLVERDESCRPQIYQARQSRDQTERQLVRDLLDRAARKQRRVVKNELEPLPPLARLHDPIQT